MSGVGGVGCVSMWRAQEEVDCGWGCSGCGREEGKRVRMGTEGVGAAVIVKREVEGCGWGWGWGWAGRVTLT